MGIHVPINYEVFYLLFMGICSKTWTCGDRNTSYSFCEHSLLVIFLKTVMQCTPFGDFEHLSRWIFVLSLCAEAYRMPRDDRWAHVHIKIDPDLKDEWEDYVDNEERISTLSALIRKSVSKEISGEFEATEEKYTEVYQELSKLTSSIQTMNGTLEVLREENIDSDEFEGGLETVIDRMEELHEVYYDE